MQEISLEDVYPGYPGDGSSSLAPASYSFIPF